MEQQLPSAQVSALVHEHLAYTRKLAKAFFSDRNHSGFDLEDFESAAMLGLCDAARRYDAKKCQRFKTFAFFRIRGAMYDMLRSESGISRQHYNRLMSNQAEEPDPEYEGVRMVSEDELPYAFAKNVSDLANLVGVLEALSMRLFVDNHGRAELAYADQATPEDIAIVSSAQRHLQSLLEELPPMQRQIIELHYIRGKTFSEIGQALGGKSKSWMSRLHAGALENLRELVGASANEVVFSDVANA